MQSLEWLGIHKIEGRDLMRIFETLTKFNGRNNENQVNMYGVFASCQSHSQGPEKLNRPLVILGGSFSLVDNFVFNS